MKILHYKESNNFLPSKRILKAIIDQERIFLECDFNTTSDLKDDFDVVYVNNLSIQARRAIRKLKSQGYPIVYQGNSNSENFRNTVRFSNLFSGLYRRFIMSSYSLADAIIVPTQHNKNMLRSYGLTQIIDVIPSPIDMKRFAYDATKVEEFREYFQLPVGQSLVIGSGHAFERKGILDFLSVARAMPDITFIWFGEADSKALPDKVTKALSQASANVIIAGYIEGRIYEGALSAADVYFYPTYEDAEVDNVIEAMASTTQVILRDIEVYRPWLSDSESCYKGDTNEDFVTLIRDSILGKITGTQQAAYKIASGYTYEMCGKLMKRTFEKVLEEDSNEH